MLRLQQIAVLLLADRALLDSWDITVSEHRRWVSGVECMNPSEATGDVLGHCWCWAIGGRGIPRGAPEALGKRLRAGNVWTTKGAKYADEWSMRGDRWSEKKRRATLRKIGCSKLGAYKW